MIRCDPLGHQRYVGSILAVVLSVLRDRRLAVCIVALALASCRTDDSAVEFLTREGYTFSRAERRTIEDIAHATIWDFRRVLPSLAADIAIRVHAASDVSDTTGASASVVGRNIVYWLVDPGRQRDVVTVATTHLRPMLYHELHHLARRIGTDDMPARSLTDNVIHEGMATVFARDFARPS